MCLLLSGLMLPHSGLAQSEGVPAKRRSAPNGDYLYEQTVQWESRRSVLGKLAELPLGKEDVVLRFWGGYGLDGTRGIIMQRIAGIWSARVMQVQTCSVKQPQRIADAGREARIEFLASLTMEDCRRDELPGPGSYVNVDTVIAGPSRTLIPDLNTDEPLDMASLWESLVDEGITRLPKTVERAEFSVSSHAYVIELRTGTRLRATSIEHLSSGNLTRADKRVQQVAHLLQEAFGVSLMPSERAN